MHRGQWVLLQLSLLFFNSSFFLTAWPLWFSGCWNYISHTPFFLSAGFSFSQMFQKNPPKKTGFLRKDLIRKLNLCICYVRRKSFRSVLKQREASREPGMCGYTALSWMHRSVSQRCCAAAVGRREYRKTDVKILREIPNAMMVNSNETWCMNFQA